jgi:hypothetical protein
MDDWDWDPEETTTSVLAQTTGHSFWHREYTPLQKSTFIIVPSPPLTDEDYKTFIRAPFWRTGNDSWDAGLRTAFAVSLFITLATIFLAFVYQIWESQRRVAWKRISTFFSFALLCTGIVLWLRSEHLTLQCYKCWEYETSAWVSGTKIY